MAQPLITVSLEIQGAETTGRRAFHVKQLLTTWPYSNGQMNGIQRAKAKTS